MCVACICVGACEEEEGGWVGDSIDVYAGVAGCVCLSGKRVGSWLVYVAGGLVWWVGTHALPF